MEDKIPICMTLLSALFTGGIFMLFIEGLQLKHKVEERLRFSLTPFFHSFSNYVKFISFFKSCFLFNENKKGYNQQIQELVEKTAKLAYATIVSGKDYPVTYFKATDLDNICHDINNIWYYIDKNRQSFYDNITYDRDYAEYNKELTLSYLKEISPKYNSTELTKELLEKVSGDFFTTIYQPIQDVLFHYEYWNEREKCFKRISYTTIGLNLLAMLIILFVGQFTTFWLPYIISTLCCIAFGLQTYFLIKIENASVME